MQFLAGLLEDTYLAVKTALVAYNHIRNCRHAGNPIQTMFIRHPKTDTQTSAAKSGLN